MKRLTCAFTIILILTITATTLNIRNTKAESIIYPAEPNKQKPTLKVHSPIRNEFYKNNTIEVTFSVTIPKSWNSYHQLETPGIFGNYTPLIGTYIGEIFLERLHQDNHITNFYWFPQPDVFTYNYSITIEGLEKGTHTAIIVLEPQTFYDNPNPDITKFSDNTYELDRITKTIPFRITSDLTPSPTPTPTTYPKEQYRDPFVTLAVIVQIAIIIVGLILLIKLNKPNSEKKAKIALIIVIITYGIIIGLLLLDQYGRLSTILFNF